MKTAETARSTCTEILNQLGGNRFLLMTGTKNIVYGTDDNRRDFVRMTLHKNASKANRLTIYYDYSLDAYDMEFEKITAPRWLPKQYTYSEPKQELINSYHCVFCDQLQELFTETTGLLTRLF